MKISSESFVPGGPIPERFALCRKDAKTHATFADNESPQLSWSELPAGTRSLALICHDSSAPTRADDVNKEGRSVPASLARADFAHWVLVDLPADTASLAAGEFSKGVTPRGKSGPAAARGTRVGLNSYTQWFEGDKDMSGRYFGYDGPAPPWNDELAHQYHFTLYALDVARCPVEGVFTREQVLDAIKGHVLGQASVMGTYTLNPKLG